MVLQCCPPLHQGGLRLHVFALAALGSAAAERGQLVGARDVPHQCDAGTAGVLVSFVLVRKHGPLHGLKPSELIMLYLI